MVKGFAVVVYPTDQVERAKAFYRDALGLTPGALFGEQYAEFDLGDSAFAVGNGKSLGIAPGSAFSAVFEVDDLQAARERVVQHGATVGELNESPMCWSVFVTDPDGNRFALDVAPVIRAT